MRQLSWKIALFLLLLPLLTYLKPVHAQSTNWFDASQPLELKLVAENIQKPPTTYWGFPCTKVGPYQIYNKYYQSINQGTASGACDYIANYGQISQERTLLLSGTSTSYRLNYQNNAPITDFIVPIPQTNDVLLFNSKLAIYRDLPSNITPDYRIDGILVQNYRLNNAVTVNDQVKYQDGTAVTEIKPNGFSFSGNGRYTALNVGRYQVLVDNQLLGARRFGANSIPSGNTVSKLITSLNSNASVALTSDSFFANTNVLYNLNNCTAGTSNGPEVCETRNLTPLFKSVVPNYTSVSLARFVNDSKIEVYFVSKDSSGIEKTDKYELTIPGSSTSQLQYLGMGDSYASGEGAYDYKLNTDVDGNMCHLSTNSYPYLIKTVLNYSTAESAACSGAMVKDVAVLRGDKKEYAEANPQAKGRDDSSFDTEIYANFLPGYRRQIDFIREYKPEAVTLSIGGNDINFGKKLLYCILSQYSCYEDQSSRQQIWQEIKNQYEKIVETYEKLKLESPQTRFYIIGYPYIVKPGGNCANNVRLSAGELQSAEDIEHDLNEMIRLAAKKVGFVYVDTSQAFSGARLCENDSWKLAVNGVTAGNDKLAFIGNETYHPNKLGHTLYKGTILNQTENLTKPMPIPDDTVSIENLESSLVPAGTPLVENVTPAVLNDGIFGDFVKAGSQVLSTVANLSQFFKPGSVLTVEIHSTPTTIGTATADGITKLHIDAQLPQNLELGPHEIHITGTNINGEPIDLYKNIIVYASEEDWDGDGTLNASDQCNFIPPIGVDVDKDGIDDGCDSEIQEPPKPAPVEPPAPVTSKERIKLLFIKIIKTIFSFLLTILRR